jgi:hypothetical protein
MPHFVCFPSFPFFAPTFAPQIPRTLLRIAPVFACPARAAVIDGCNPHTILHKAIAPQRVPEKVSLGNSSSRNLE